MGNGNVRELGPDDRLLGLQLGRPDHHVLSLPRSAPSPLGAPPTAGGSRSMSREDQLLIERVLAAHEGYDMYPCFFMCQESGEVIRIGSLQNFKDHLRRDPAALNRRHIAFCLGDNKCIPCDKAKADVAQMKDVEVRFLEREGEEVRWYAGDLQMMMKKKPIAWRVV